MLPEPHNPVAHTEVAMSCPALYQWTQRVATHFPALTPAQVANLAQYSFGAVVAHACGLSAVAGALATLLGQTVNTCRQRLREWYQEASAQSGCGRSEVDTAACFGPLLDWILATWSTRRLALALDPTTLADRWIVLTVAVVYRGCGVPVAWKILAADQRGSWNQHWRTLLEQLADRLGNDWTVTVLSDRGLESRELFTAITALGWHPLMRIKKAGHFRPSGWKQGGRATRLVPRVGTRWRGSGAAYTGSATLSCTLLACWEAGHEEPWLILTDLAPTSADAVWYGWRCWIEQTFKVIKRGGWQWHKSRMEDASRVERLWVVLAVATLWLLEVGGEAEANILPETMPEVKKEAKGSRGRSVFRHGWQLILSALIGGQPLPRGRFVPEDWPAVPEHELVTENDLQ
jgi:hypothetical protein